MLLTPRPHPAKALTVLLALTVSHHTLAQSNITQCRALANDLERLQCYDQIATHSGRDATRLGADSSAAGQPAAVLAGNEATMGDDDDRTHPAIAQRSRSGMPGTLSQRWELDPQDKHGLFRITAYRPTYALFARYSSNPNQRPFTPAPGHQVSSSLDLDSIESKFQLSFKTKALENLFGDNGDLWFAYTQQSSWQVYNSVNSAPFRETNYEPEVFLTLRTNAHFLGFDWRLLNLGVVHQSNGRNLPLSRSWNRAYAQVGLERGNLSLFVRPWLRFNESSRTDDNPGISDYMGHGDLLAVYHHGKHEFSALSRYSAVGNRATVQLDWHFPLNGTLKGYVQLFSGYGETLVDYNIRQNIIGVGVSLTQWQ